MARRPVRPVQVFRVYNKVADVGDVVIRIRGFSIVDTRERAIAISLLSLCFEMMNPYPHKSQIFLVERHQEVGRSVDSLDLHYITSVVSLQMSRNERHTLFHQQAFKIGGS